MKKIIWLLISYLMVLSLVLASCAEEEEEEEIIPTEEEEIIIPEEEEEVVVPPAEGNWWDYHGEPEYGGTLNWRLMGDISSWDPWRADDWSGLRAMYNEGLWGMNWTTDRKEMPLQGGYSDPFKQEFTICESFEFPDDLTYIIHIRPGVYWQDKPPMNGREFTADDLAYYWYRMGGLGGGFESGTPYVFHKGYLDIESITVPDKYTIIFKTHYPVPGWWQWQHGPGGINMPREVVEQYGDLADWKNAVGTGPFLLEDYVAGSSATYIRNPNYWGWDQRHPEKEIPYIDGVKFLIIPDQSTAYAALRTGKIFMVTGVPWEQADSFEKTNPELGQVPILGGGMAIAMRVDREPFTDINVRKAMNMAINHKELAETYFGGRVEGKPYGIYGPSTGPYYTPFEEWPEELQEGHSYNPAGARQLLAEAGYPNGFKTSLLVSSASDMDLPQILKGYYADIGVDIEIETVESTVFFSYVYMFHKHDQMVWGPYAPTAFGAGPPVMTYSSKWFMNPCMTVDPVFDEMVDREAIYHEGDPRKWEQDRANDMYALSKYWSVPTLPTVSYILYQPWIRGYSEEYFGASGYIFARLWIDHDLKRSMGH